MKTKIKQTGNPKAFAERQLREQMAEALDALGARAVEALREELTTGPRSGALVKKDGGVHRASAPGEVPASWTGALAASLRYEVAADASGLTIHADAPYATYLEYGTLDIGPRPFLGPAMDRIQSDVDGILARSFGGKTSDKGGGA